MDKTFKTGVVIVGDESGAVRSYKAAGAAADAFADKVQLSATDGRKAYEQLLDAIDPARRALRVLDEQQEQLRAHLRAGTADSKSYAAAMALIDRERKDLTDGLHSLGGATQGVRQELSILVGETMRGNFGQLKNSLLSLAQQAGVLKTILTPAGGIVTAVASAVAGYAAVTYIAERETRQLTAALTLTNNAAGLTHAGFEVLVTNVGEAIGSFGEARDILLALVQTGQFSASALGNTARAIHAVAEASGRSSDEVTADFSKMANGVAQWALEHNRSYHFLTADQYEHIATLEREGRAQDAIAEVTGRLTDRIRLQGEAIGFWTRQGRAWGDLLDLIKTKIIDLGRADTIDDQIAKQLKVVQQLLASRYSMFNGLGGNSAAFEAELQQQQKLLQVLQMEKALDEQRAARRNDSADVEQALIESANARKADVASIKQQIAVMGQGEAAARRYAMEQELINRVKVGSIAEDARLVAGIKANWAERIKEAESLDRLTKSQNENRVSKVGMIKADADAVVELAQSNQQLAENALKAEMQSGLMAYADYYQQLENLENDFYGRTAAARATEAAQLQQELQRLTGLGARAPEGALQSARTELQQLLDGNAKLLAEHQGKLKAYGRELADAMHGTVTAVVPAIDALDRYELNMVRAEQAEAAGLITKQQLALYQQQLTLALQESVDPGAATIRQLELENDAIAAGIPLEQARLALKLQQLGQSPEEIAATMDRIRALTHEKQVLQDLFGDQTDPTAAMRQGFEELRNTVIDMSNEWGRAAASMVSGIENVAKAGEFAAEARQKQGKQQADAWLASTKAGMEGYAQLTSGAAGFFNEGSRGYKALMTASQAFHAAELALEIAGLVPKATAAILTQGSGDPYTAFGRMAAMAAIVAALGVSTGWGGGGGGSFSKPNSGIGAGKGTVLGNSDAMSKSIANSLEQLVDLQDKGLYVSQAQLTTLRAIEAGINGVGDLLYRSNISTGGPTPFAFSTSSSRDALGSAALSANRVGLGLLGTNDFLTKIFGSNGFVGAIAAAGDMVPDLISGLFDTLFTSIFGSTKVKQVDSGLIIAAGQNFGDIVAGDLDAMYYATVQITKKKLFGLSKSKKTKDVTEDVGDTLTQQFTDIILGIGDSVLQAAELLGADAQKAEDILNALPIDIGKISLDGLSSDEVQEKLNSVFSALGDSFVEAVLPGVSEFQQTGEGLYETLMRVASETSAVKHVFDELGISLDAAIQGLDLARIADSLIDLSGGIDQFASNVNDYLQGFFSDDERTAILGRNLAEQLDAISLVLPTTRDGFRALVEGIDVTTESGQQALATLLGLAGAADQYYDGLDDSLQKYADAADELKNFRDQIKDVADAANGVSLSGLRSQFGALLTRARLGDLEAMGLLPDAGNALQQASLALSGTRTEYLRDLARIQSGAAAAEATATRLSMPEIAQQQLDALKQQTDILQSIDDTLHTKPAVIVSQAPVVIAGPASATASTSAASDTTASEVAAMRAELAQLKDYLHQITLNTGKTAAYTRNLDDWTYDGLPASNA